MVHIVPMNWTNYEPGQNVQVEVYSNAKTVELLLNRKSLGTKSFDAKTSTDGTNYLETTSCTNDDKNYTSGSCPGSYESPNGSSGNLQLTWNVPLQRGKLVAVATEGTGRQVARDPQQSAGKAATVTLTPDKTVLRADGKSLSYFTASVVDAKGVTVPNGGNPLTFKVAGAGTFEGADNGKQDDAEGYKAATRKAFNGKEVVIVEAKAGKAGPITLTATGDDLAPTTSTIYSVNKNARGLVGIAPAHTRTPQGSRPTLPQTVTAVYADGSTHAVPVHWQQPGRRLALGVHTVTEPSPASTRSHMPSSASTEPARWPRTQASFRSGLRRAYRQPCWSLTPTAPGTTRGSAGLRSDFRNTRPRVGSRCLDRSCGPR